MIPHAPVFRRRVHILPRDGELCIFVDAESVIVSIPIRSLDRLVLSDDVTISKSDSTFSGDAIAKVGEDRFVAWDLDSLIGHRGKRMAWVLMHVDHGRSSVPIALRTGPCLIVERLREAKDIPKSLFRERGDAFTGVFAAKAAIKREIPVSVGLLLDPNRLFSFAELEKSAKLLSGSEVRTR